MQQHIRNALSVIWSTMDKEKGPEQNFNEKKDGIHIYVTRVGEVVEAGYEDMRLGFKLAYDQAGNRVGIEVYGPDPVRLALYQEMAELFKPAMRKYGLSGTVDPLLYARAVVDAIDARINNFFIPSSDEPVVHTTKALKGYDDHAKLVEAVYAATMEKISMAPPMDAFLGWIGAERFALVITAQIVLWLVGLQRP